MPHPTGGRSRLGSSLAALIVGAAIFRLGAALQLAQAAGAAPKLEEVATFEHQVTGVAVSHDGRIFVTFPRWTEDAPVSVAEVTGGNVRPFPDEEWNSWRNTKRDKVSAQEHFVCAQRVVADNRGSLWVIDPAAPAAAFIVPGGPKLVRIDLRSNSVADVIHFDEGVAPQGSYLNDLSLSPDGRRAYLTDSGAKGAIIVVNLQTKQARRVLDGDPSTQVEKGVVVRADGRELRRPDGRGLEVAAAGIALSPDGHYLYWKALTGRTLYRIATEALEESRVPAEELPSLIERIAVLEPTDGLWIDEHGTLYIAAIERNAVDVGKGRRYSSLVQDKRLRWPDSFAQGPDQALYVTSSRVQDMSWFVPENGARLETQLWRINPGGTE
jgi:sugar lactone lactonase YvrE